MSPSRALSSLFLRKKSLKDHRGLANFVGLTRIACGGNNFILGDKTSFGAKKCLLCLSGCGYGGVQKRGLLGCGDEAQAAKIYEEKGVLGYSLKQLYSTVAAVNLYAKTCGSVAETVAYDLVLEVAMRDQHFQQRNLVIHGPWKWLLTEFASYFGVSDAYTKLRYLSYVMDVATPTADCLTLVYDLLMPVVMKGNCKSTLSHQENRILGEIEDQLEQVFALAFENYKSLDETTPSGMMDVFRPATGRAAPALEPAVKLYKVLHDILSPEAQNKLYSYFQAAAKKRSRRHLTDTDEYVSGNNEGMLVDVVTITTAYQKMKSLCTNIRNEIFTDIDIHNQHILPSFIDLPNLSTAIYSAELCNRLRSFLIACPPSGPSPHVTELVNATADFQRDLSSWSINPVKGGVDAKELFHLYIMLWIQDKRLALLEACKLDKVKWSGVRTQYSTTPFVDEMYDRLQEILNDYGIIISRWPEYTFALENTTVSEYGRLDHLSNWEFNEGPLPGTCSYITYKFCIWASRANSVVSAVGLYALVAQKWQTIYLCSNGGDKKSADGEKESVNEQTLSQESQDDGESSDDGEQSENEDGKQSENEDDKHLEHEDDSKSPLQMSDFAKAMRARADGSENMQRPPKSKLMRCTNFMQRPPVVKYLERACKQDGDRVFEMRMKACPPPYESNIHGGRAGFIANGSLFVTHYIPSSGQEAKYMVSAFEEFETLSPEVKSLMGQIWKSENSLLNSEAEDDKFVVVRQMARHSRYSENEEVPKYMELTTKMGEWMKEQLRLMHSRFGFTSNAYYHSDHYLKGIRKHFGVDGYIHVLPSPHRRSIPVLEEVALLWALTPEKKLLLINHPTARKLLGAFKGLFYYP